MCDGFAWVLGAHLVINKYQLMLLRPVQGLVRTRTPLNHTHTQVRKLRPTKMAPPKILQGLECCCKLLILSPQPLTQQTSVFHRPVWGMQWS
jgi:hypothetical protein